MIFLDHRNPAWIHLNDIINFQNVWQAEEKHTSKNNNIWLVFVFDPPGYMYILKATNKMSCSLMCSLSHGTQKFTNYQDINPVLKCMSKQINLRQNLFPKVLTTRWPQLAFQLAFPQTVKCTYYYLADKNMNTKHAIIIKQFKDVYESDMKYLEHGIKNSTLSSGVDAQ